MADAEGQRLPDATNLDPRRSRIALKVNGLAYRVDVANTATLAQLLREELQLKPGQELIVYVFDGSIRFSKPRSIKDLRGIAKGHTTKRMAGDLGLAAPSIETHLHNIFRKLSATNRGEAVSTALKVGLLTLADM